METQAMPQSLDIATPVKRWLTFERRNWIALIAVGAFVGYGFGNGHTTQGAVQNISDQLGRTRKAEGCEHWRANKATSVANQAVVSNYTMDVPVPDLKAIPKDCQHPQSKE